MNYPDPAYKTLSGGGLMRRITTGAPVEYDTLKELAEGKQDKNKAYAPLEFSGLGKKTLEKNIVDVNGVNKNILTQAMVSEANTEFVVQYDYDLNDPDGENPITIPANCALKFEGGTIKNGVIDLNGCTINADTKIFEDVVPAENSILVQDINPMWFGAKGDGVTDDTDAWEACIAFTKQIKPANLNTFRQYTRPQARISAPKHAHFKITRPLTITFQCDIVGGFRFDYYGAYPAENTGIINFYGTFSQCTYQFDIMYCQLTSSATGSFSPDWSNVPPFAGIAIGSSANPTYMEECTFTAHIYKCQIGIRAYGHSGSRVITSPTFLNCGFYTCIIGVENYIHEIDGSPAWNNCYKFYNCEFRPSSSGYQVPTGTERFAFCKVCGDGNYMMTSSIIDGLELEGSPFGLPQSILWVDKQDNGDTITSGMRISNVRAENIGYAFIKSNRLFSASLIDCSRWLMNQLYVNINGVTFTREVDIPGFTVIYGQSNYSYNFIKRFDYYDQIRKSLIQPNGSGIHWYRIKGTLLLDSSYYYVYGKRSTSAVAQLGVLFKVQNGGLMEVTADVKSGGTYRLQILDKTTLSMMEIDTTKFVTFGLRAYTLIDQSDSSTKVVGYAHSVTNPTLDGSTAHSWLYNNTGDDVVVAFNIIRPNYLSEITDETYPIEVRGDSKVSVFSTDDYFNVDGAKADMPKDLQPSDAGFRFHDIYNDIVYTWNGLNWVFEDGWSSNVNSGASSARPSLGFGEDGYKFHDTTLGKDIYSKVIQEPVLGDSVAARVDASTPSTKTISNTLTEGKKYWLGFSAKNTWSGSVRLRKTADSSDGEIWLLATLNNNDLGVYFTAPSPTDYPYIYMVNGWADAETFTFHEPATSWVEEDGATAGVARSGDTASRPASTDIYTGFQYWDTDLGKMIAWNSSAWVNLDGTALS